MQHRVGSVLIKVRKEKSPSWWQQKNAPFYFQDFQPLFPISPEKQNPPHG
ncbi:hypothetical protein [Akkermansia sp.]|jgi:hypothetical protein